MAVTLQRRLFTSEEYHKMAEAGILPERGVELLHGEIIDMSPIGSQHAAVVDRLTRLLSRRLPEDYILRVQSPIRTDEQSEPEPDLSILSYREDFYAGGLPTPEDVWLLIEVSGRSLAYDREVKIPHYAESGIPECWLVDLLIASSGTVSWYPASTGRWMFSIAAPPSLRRAWASKWRWSRCCPLPKCRIAGHPVFSQKIVFFWYVDHPPTPAFYRRGIPQNGRVGHPARERGGVVVR